MCYIAFMRDRVYFFSARVSKLFLEAWK